MDIEDLKKPNDDKLNKFVIQLSKTKPKNNKEYTKFYTLCRKKYRMCPSKIILNEVSIFLIPS